MQTNKNKKLLLALTGFITTLASFPASAYIGPGAGLGMVGSLIAIVVVVLVIVLGLVIYPIRMMRKKRRAAAAKSAEPES